eukprot:jgi/Chlat1/8282/Chrsp78S07708
MSSVVVGAAGAAGGAGGAGGGGGGRGRGDVGTAAAQRLQDEWLSGRGLLLDCNEQRGRGLRAARSFQPGELLFSQPAYAAALDACNQSSRCDACARPESDGVSLKRCSGCKLTYYCSAQCQRLAWTVHKLECPLLRPREVEEARSSSPSSRTPTSTMRLVIRALIRRHLEDKEVIRPTAADAWALMQSLESPKVAVPSLTDSSADRANMAEDRLITSAQIAHLIKSITQSSPIAHLSADTSAVTTLICQVLCNAHTMCDDALEPYGTGMYPVVSLLNHDCDPSTIVTFVGMSASVTMSYTELLAGTVTRQKALRDNYYFESCMQDTHADRALEALACTQRGCDGLLAPSEGMDDGDALVCDSCGAAHDKATITALEDQAARFVQEAEQLRSSKRYTKARDTWQSAVAAYQELLPSTGIRLKNAREELFKECITLQDWDTALAVGRDFIAAHALSFMPNSPVLGLHHFTLAKIYWSVGL